MNSTFKTTLKLTLSLSLALVLLFALGLLADGLPQTVSPAYAAGETCFATINGSTVYSSTDAGALRLAVTNAITGATVKVAGTCAGVAAQGGSNQVVYINKNLTLTGGYTTTNWLAAPDSNAYPTVLDAQGGGRVVVVTNNANVTLSHLTLRGGNASSGGAVYLDSNTTTAISNSRIEDNQANLFGGGITNDGDLTLATSTVSGNQVLSFYGGGIFNTGAITVTASAFLSNTASTDGGGLYNSGAISGYNNTFSGNSAGDQGGGLYSVSSATGNQVSYSTFSGNSATTGGGGVYGDSGLQLYGVIVANSPAGGDCASVNAVSDAVQDGGYNLIEDGSCLTTGSSLSGDPLLAPLADNGGQTQTHALQESSPALLQIPAGSCAPTTDQRGTSRPQFSLCDMGAYENSIDFPPIAVDDVYTATEDVALTVVAPGVLDNDIEHNSQSMSVTLQSGVSHGTLSLNSDGSFVYTPTLNFNGTDGFTYQVSDGTAVAVAYWPFDEGSGATAIDATGNGHDSALTNGPLYTTTVPATGFTNSYALSFDGVDDVVAVPDSADINTASHAARTVSLWFKADDVTINSRKQILWEEGGGGNGLNIYLYDGTLYAGAWSSTYSWSGTWLSSTAITSGQWYHVALVLDSSSTTGPEPNALRLYLNGALAGSGAGAKLSDHGANNALGDMIEETRFHDGLVGGSGGYAFAGLLDDVRIYNLVLSQSEVQATMNSQLGIDTAQVTLTVTPVDDNPVLVANNPLTVTQSLSGTITNLNLQATDVDDPPAGITYTLDISPTAGVLWLGASPLDTDATFTQADIDAGLLTYHQDGSAVVADTFTFSLDAKVAASTRRVSVDSAGNQANDWSDRSSISADGRYVAFYSKANNLVSGDTNGIYDIFVYDTQTGTIRRVSVDSAGNQANSWSDSPGISADGRYVAFGSNASNLVSGDTNGIYDIFVHDTQTGITRRVSVDSAGNQANDWSDYPSLSADGRYVAFYSNASNLVSGDSNGWGDVFVHDTQTGETSRVSVDSAGNQGNGDSDSPGISADGRYVVFKSVADNLVAGDTNGARDIFVHDTQTGTTRRVSVDSAGNQGNGHSDYPGISADGRYVAFPSAATNLVSGDTNGKQDIFVHDTQTGTTRRVSVDSAGNQGNGHSNYPSLSADGRYVAFHSEANTLVAGDTNGTGDIFVHDTQTGETRRVSVDSAGNQGNGNNFYPQISAEGRYVAFPSNADNLVSGDTNGSTDIFLYDAGGSPPQDTFLINIIHPPVAAADSYTTPEDTPVSGNVISDDTGNGPDRDIDNDPLTATLQTDVGHGALTFNSDGSFVYTSTLNFNGNDGFTYILSDGSFTDTAQVTLTVTPVDDDPVLVANNPLTVTQSLSGTITNLNLQATDVDDPPAGITYTLDISPTAGVLWLGASPLDTDATFTQADIDAGLLTYYQGGSAVVTDTFTFSLDKVAASTRRVSVDSAGNQANGGNSQFSHISADGRYVAFYSEADNLVAGDTNGVYDVFVHDTQTGITRRISVDSAGNQANDWSGYPSISADGRYVDFGSAATNLVAGDTNGVSDVFVHDTQTGETRRVSVDSAGNQGNGDSYSNAASLSADGRYVAFGSAATNLVAGDTNGVSDVFVHDTQTGETRRVSVDSAGNQANEWSSNPSLSADGRYVAFLSWATNLVASDTTGKVDVFVHDTQTGETRRVSVDSAGNQANGHNYEHQISADGRYVAFRSYATNLVAGDTNGVVDIFVHDTQTGETRRVSVDSAGNQANTTSYAPSLSADGRYVAFDSAANNLVAGDTNGTSDVFVHDTQTGATRRVSVDSADNQANSYNNYPSISADGRYVAFRSNATNLVSGDTNGKLDIFLYDTGNISLQDTFLINIDLTNPLVATPNSYTTAEDTPVSGNVISDDSGNGRDSDADNDPLTATLQTGVSNGTLTLNTDGSFVYTPTLNFNGNDSFSYIASDGALTDTAQVTLTVTPVNDPPVASDDSYTTAKDTAVSGNVISDDTGNGSDSDAENDPLTAVLQTDVNSGTLTLNADGSFVYTPTLNFSGTDGFTYQVSDGGATAVAYWPLDEGSGMTATDATGSGHAGTLSNGPLFTTTVPATGFANSYALSFDGVDDVVTVADSADINTGSYAARTVSLWFKADDVTINSRKQVLWQEGGGTNGLNIYLFDGALYAGAWSNASNWSGTWLSSTAVTSGQWHHVALVLDSSSTTGPQADALRLYLDGVLVGSGAGAQLGPHLGDISLGDLFDGSQFHDGIVSGSGGRAFAGLLDDVRIHNLVLSQSEVQAVMNSQPGLADTAQITITVTGAGSDTTPPTLPALISPADGSVITTTQTPAFDWTDATDTQSGVVSYTLLITGSSGAQQITTTVSSYTPSTDLATGVYTWTVRAHDGAGNASGWVSPPFTFTLAVESGTSVYLPIVVKGN